MKLLEGKQLASDILNKTKEAVSDCSRIPGFGAVLVGEDVASKMYVDLKKKAAHKCGVLFSDYRLPENVKEEQVLEIIKFLNADAEIDGILIQLPLPKHLNKEIILNAVDSRKDVDGLTRKNRLCAKEEGECFICPFPKAIMKLLEQSGISLSGKNGMVLANSEGFGSVMTSMLSAVGIEARYLLGSQKDIYREDILSADVVVSAMGHKNFITSSMIKDGAIIIDGGIEKDGEAIYGDVAMNEFMNRDVLITPVPGGVGPVTVACLIENVWLASQRNKNKSL